MKCESCGIKIKAEFAFAIKNNQCPACGKSIMDSVKLASYISLRELLIRNFGEDVYAEKIARLVVANFELKQIFKDELPKSENAGTIETETESVEEDDEPEGPVYDEDGIKYEKVDKDKAQAMLRKMRDQALEEALNNRDIDFTESDMLLLNDQEARQEQLIQNKQDSARQNIQSGAKGSFVRSE